MKNAEPKAFHFSPARKKTVNDTTTPTDNMTFLTISAPNMTDRELEQQAGRTNLLTEPPSYPICRQEHQLRTLEERLDIQHFRLFPAP